MPHSRRARITQTQHSVLAAAPTAKRFPFLPISDMAQFTLSALKSAPPASPSGPAAAPAAAAPAAPAAPSLKVGESELEGSASGPAANHSPP